MTSPYHIYGRSTIPPFVYQPNGWNTVWKAARDASITTPCWIAFSGDSTMQGAQTSDAMTASWTMLLRAELIGTYGLYADCWSPVYDPTRIPINFTGAPWTNTANGATVSNNARTIGPTVEFVGGTPVQTFVAPYASTEIDINYRDVSTGTFRVQIDGANAGSTASLPFNVGNISPSYAGGVLTITVTKQNGLVRRRLMVTGLDNVAHTVTIDQQSGSNQQAIPGVSVFNGTTGIGFYHGACGGFSANSYAAGFNTINTWSWQGYVDASHTTGAGYPAQPHLLILDYGINDCSSSVTIANYKAAMEVFIQGVRAGRSNASILIIAYSSPGQGSDTAVGNRWGNWANWPNYMKAMYQLAQQYTCGFLNIHRRWHNSLDTQATGYMTATNLHPTDAASIDIYNAVRALL